VDVPDPYQVQPFLLGSVQPLPQLLESLVREPLQLLPELVGNPHVQDPFRVANHEAKVVFAGTFYPQYLPRERLLSSLLQPIGREVADGLGDEVLVGKSGRQMQVDLESPLRANRTLWEGMSSSTKGPVG
jgi:hypothetical protein